jgi:hypothetical protein
VGIPYNFYNDKKWEEMMAGPTSKTYAKYSSYTVFARGGPQSYFIFYVSKVKYEFSVSGRYNFLTKGDTVLIKYAISDPNYAKVIDFHYKNRKKENKK